MKKFETFLKFIGERGWIIEETAAEDKKIISPMYTRERSESLRRSCKNINLS